MKTYDADDVLSIIDDEGFDYTFMHKSYFMDVKDERFHQLRRAYVDAHRELEEYILKHSSEATNER